MSFFNTTPLGRIVSRFSKDLYSIDLELVDHFDFFLFATLNVVISIGTILFVTPWFGVAVVPLGILYFRILNYFRDVSRETKRLDSITRSPVYALFSETLGGLETIRAFAEPERFKKNFGEKVDSNTRANYNNKSADRWLSVRLELIGSTVAGLAAAFASQSAIAAGTSDSSFASLAGLSLTFAISVTSLLNFCVRSFATLEAGMNSVERVIYYTESIPHEAPRTSEELEEQARLLPNAPPSKAALFAVQACDGKAESFTSPWPEKGAVALHSLKMSYREDTPLVLKGVTIGIEGGSRIGVVGRTGSGKSSLLLTLLRLVEPTLQLDDDEPYSAPILIDGVDILRIGLKELRSNVGIIPQNPVLFSGTIRTNIDPFRKFSDEDIWNALEQCGLKEAVEGMPEKLDGIVSEYGQNLSAGMRQQLVLGRALLRQCRILLLDEATSSVDFETDKEIQRTIRENFTDCTVITIAHRINTIMDSSKILVMRDGLAAEFDTPENLLKDETSLFSDIVRHAQAEENKN
jgi:ABC-type multidrug transport system fused ATPase/permease subunit